MKIYGAINDGYRFIYSLEKWIVEDWLFVYPNHFCILKVFEIEIDDDTYLMKHNDLDINIDFNKKSIPQESYNNTSKNLVKKPIFVLLNNGKAHIEIEKSSGVNLELTHEEQVILKTTRQLKCEKELYGNH